MIKSVKSYIPLCEYHVEEYKRLYWDCYSLSSERIENFFSKSVDLETLCDNEYYVDNETYDSD